MAGGLRRGRENMGIFVLRQEVTGSSPAVSTKRIPPGKPGGMVADEVDLIHFLDKNL